MYTILGSGGMLGSEICALLDARHEPYDTVKIGPRYDLRWLEDVRQAGRWTGTLINCAGALTEASIEEQTYVNAIVPQLVRPMFDKIIYVSTDCVFSGNLQPDSKYDIYSIPDPTSSYGITKRLGELSADKVIRTSFIGYRHGLLRWAIDQSVAKWWIEGWVNALWNGSTVDAIASRVLAIADADLPDDIVHIAMQEPISKYDLLREISFIFDLGLNITPKQLPKINRALDPTYPISRSIEQALRNYKLSIKQEANV